MEENNRSVYLREPRDKVFIPAKEKANIYDINGTFRACAYCRVSTESDQQKSSFDIQQEHYEQLVSTHPNWDLQHIYADQGISGTSLKNRTEFNQMIAACEAGEYDLIITKSVSRFARNLVDCVSLARKLKNQTHPVGIFFETDNLFTLSEDSELKLSLLATFAQEESVKKSESMVWSLKERFKNERLLTPELFGYDRPRNSEGKYIKYAKLQVVESEAEVVRFIFDAFLAGYSKKSIAEILTEIGCKTKIGNTEWSEGSISYILSNERYCGNVLTWKTFTADMFEHKHRKNRQDRDQYLYTGNHEAIITLEQFEAAQVLLEQHRHGYKGRMPTIQVIESGIFKGYVPVNHHWINENPTLYYEASNSVSSRRNVRQFKRSAFSAFDLKGYQVVRTPFMMQRIEHPCITITNTKIVFNVQCLEKFANVRFIQLLLHPTERKIAIRPCAAKDIYSIPWKKDLSKRIVSKAISCPHFASALFSIMEWNPDYIYKVTGVWASRENDSIMVFDLMNAAPSISVIDENGGERKKRKVQICPERWAGNFGDEFYRHSIDHILAVEPDSFDWNASAQSRPIYSPDQFMPKDDEEISVSIENLRLKVGGNDE